MMKCTRSAEGAILQVIFCVCVWLLGYRSTDSRHARSNFLVKRLFRNPKLFLKMSDSNEDDKGQNSKMAFSTLFADGEWMFVKEDYENAIKSLTAALALSPGEKNCLVCRAKCYMKLGHLEKALKDAETSLLDDETFSEGLYLKAETLFLMGEFEFALVFYRRGFNIRPHKFRLGMQKAQEAIENSIGSPSTVELEIAGDLSFLKKEEERVQPITVIRELMKEKRRDAPKTYKNEKTTKQLLGEFYSDKKFLEDLMKDEDLVKGVTTRGERVQDIIQSCITSLDKYTEIWSQEKPVSLRKKEQSANSAEMDAALDPAQFVLKSLGDTDAEMTSVDEEGSLKKAEET
ncbi:tetratricopeptide repeat protein 25 [Kryptolebias marmoratus]|uniref:tetratricopeptide repeat protein 25 n=1 Tax=Kryptolebias marmoratus TaxID=37003 RepID=UPI0007F879E8|nr:tetratricopeptide repeat protein 25 [Kryptolebias marmoratus]